MFIEVGVYFLFICVDVRRCFIFFKCAENWIDEEYQKISDIEEFGFAKTLINTKTQETLF